MTAAVLPLAFGACSWFTDFKTQPAIEPWEPVSQNINDTTHAPRSAPLYSVPVSGVVCQVVPVALAYWTE